jgi:hypothetical protein
MFPKLKINTVQLLDNCPELYDCLNKYYPIGLTRDDENYFSYPGIKVWNEIVEKNIFQAENHKKEWKTGFLENFKKKLDFKNVVDTTMGLVPNFSGIIELKDNLNSRTQLRFYKSLIGNYFTIEVLENIRPKEISHPIFGKRKIWEIENIITSPVGEYETLFLKVYEAFIEKYEGIKFIPYIWDIYLLNDLDVPHTSNPGEEVSVAGAFFKKHSKYDDSINILGDIKYEINKLKKDGHSPPFFDTILPPPIWREPDRSDMQ